MARSHVRRIGTLFVKVEGTYTVSSTAAGLAAPPGAGAPAMHPPSPLLHIVPARSAAREWIVAERREDAIPHVAFAPLVEAHEDAVYGLSTRFPVPYPLAELECANRVAIVGGTRVGARPMSRRPTGAGSMKGKRPELNRISAPALPKAGRTPKFWGSPILSKRRALVVPK